MFIIHIGFLACFHAISFERSRFSKIAMLFSCSCSTDAIGSHLVACSARIVVEDKQLATLAAHARQGLILSSARRAASCARMHAAQG